MNMPSTETKPEFEFMLDRECYVSDEVFRKEHENIYTKGWIFAGHTSQLPKKGDYFMIEFGGEEIVVVRGKDDQFHANMNVCRHRGYRLCKDKKGHVPAFICGYHQWRFALDGHLEKVPMSKDGECFDYADYGLKTAHTEVWNGMIFVHLGEKPQYSLTDELNQFQPVADQFEPQNTKLAHEEVYHIDANWKVVVENAMECYHCAATHSKSLCRVVDVPKLMEDLGDWIAFDEQGPDATLGMGGMSVKQGAATMSGDGTLICEKLLGKNGEEEVKTAITGGVMVLPNFLYAAFYVDHWWTIAIRPQSAGKTVLVYSWYVRKDAEAGVDYDVEKLIEMGHLTQLEDNVLIERTQEGINSEHFAPGPLIPYAEAGITDFVRRYRASMA